MADEPTRDDLRRREAAFDRHLSAAAQGRLARPDPARDQDLEEQLAATVRRVHALAGHPLPDPNRADRLWRNLMSGYTPTASLPLAPSLPRPLNGRGQPARPVPRPIPRPHRAPGRLSAGFSLLATMALIAIVLGMIYFVFRDGQRAVVPSAQGTPTAAPAPTENWPMYRGDPGRTGNLPVHGPTGTPVELWRYQTQGQIDAAPAIVDGVLYIASEDGNLYALDTKTGALVWKAPMGAGSGASVVVDNGVIYVVDHNHTLHAFDAATGQERWHADGIDDLDPGPVVDGVTFVGGTDGKLHAFDATDGEERWATPLGGGGASRSTADADGLVVVGSKDGHVNALDAASGTLRWSVAIGGGTVGTSPIADGVVYAANFGGTDNKLVALGAADGTQLWTFQTPTRADLRSPAVGGGLVYTVSGDGNLYALDTATGTERFHTATGGPVTAAPALASGVVYVASHDFNVYAVDAASGRVVWKVGYGGATDYGPVVADGRIYLGTNIGYVIAFDSAATAPATGSPASAGNESTGTATPAGTGAVSAESVWTTTGDPNSPLREPDDIVIDPHGTLWVTHAPGQFQLFDLDGTYLETWGTPGSGDGQFNFVRPNGDNYGGVAFGHDGSIYVVDTGNLRVQKFDRDRNFVASWGTKGTGDGQFLDPLSIAIDGQGLLYVLDDLRDDVQVFDGSGAFVRKFRVHDSFGSPSGLENSSNLINVDGAGNVYVTSVLRSSVLKFDPSGKLLAEIGGPGNGDGQFGQPVDVAIDSTGDLFVSDVATNRVEVFDAGGHFIMQWGHAGQSEGEITGPAGVAVRGRNAYVAEYGGNRVQKFRLTGPLPAPAATPSS